ncbi:MAG TPA: hypothetical protein VFP98_01605, partial [Candidatus Polarisedimenticolia bacterium]|nr:hypothetical protein [Candidatus Polarisedimenticolia bacterium]
MPIGLHQIVGHAQPLRLIRRSLAEGRLHHSMIFHGPEAVGKRTVALALAATLNCDARGEDACGACPSCSKISRSLHPDVRYITLEKSV